MKIKYIALGAALLALSPAISPSEAQARQMCRDYTKTSLINGRLHTGTAQACTHDRRHWNVTSMNAPIEQRAYLISMIERDVYNLGGINIEFASVRNYSAPVVYSSRFTETRVRHVAVPVYTNRYYKSGHKHHNKHDVKYDRHDRYERSDWRDDNRGSGAFKQGRIQHPHAHLARP